VEALAKPVAELSAAQRGRYARQILLEGFGSLAQRRLLGARVLVVGAGGLGSPVLLYLAGAGVGSIGIIDDDAVDPSNLHRQVIHTLDAVCLPKVTSAAAQLRALNPDVQVIEYPQRLSESNAREVIAEYDLVIDGTDNFLTRYVVDAACSDLSIPEVWGSILRYAGQVSVFWTGERAYAHGVAAPGVCLRDLFPAPPPPGAVPACGEAGVLGSLCGQVGAIMASEAIKMLTGTGEPLLGKVLVIDSLKGRTDMVDVHGAEDRPEPLRGEALSAACASPMPGGAATPRQAGIPGGAAAQGANSATSAAVTVEQLAELLAARQAGTTDFTLVDVREENERAINAIPGSAYLPLGRILADPQAARAELGGGPLYLYCLGGARSQKAVDALKAAGADAINVEGGIRAWWTRIDPDMPQY